MLKKESIGVPELYLGEKVSQVVLNNGQCRDFGILDGGDAQARYASMLHVEHRHDQ